MSPNTRLLTTARTIVITASIVAMLISAETSAQTGQAEPIAHAHNDYEHQNPLHDALAAGFTSVEADVYLVENRLLVAHDRDKTTLKRTLQSLYLDPLTQHFENHPPNPEQSTFWLMIDVKSEPISTFQRIHQVLNAYPKLIRVNDDPKSPIAGKQIPPVRVVISGNRAKEVITETQPHMAGIDGRLTDLNSDFSPKAMPWISDNWKSHFSWRGIGRFPAKERNILRDYVRQAHAKGRLIRFWATPDEPVVWDELIAAGVDLINTDDLQGLRTHLKTRDQKQQVK